MAFIPGISGELFRQFAVTVSVAMFLSAINALTLSPALCGVLLRPHRAPRGVMGWLMRSIDYVRDAYGAAIARIVRFSAIGLAMVVVAGVGIVQIGKATRTGFLPEDDQGALFVVVQLPGGASVARTTSVVQQAEEILKKEDAIADYISVVGLNFIDNYSQSNAAFLVVTLKPFEERKDASQSVRSLIARLGEKFRQIQGGVVVPLALPPVIGLGTGGGFSYVLEDLRGGDPKTLAQTLRGLVVAANQNPNLAGVFTTFSATNPSIFLDIDRDKAQILGAPLNAVFQALQTSLGGYYVNDINLYGRRWQVQVQAEADDRNKVDDIYRINVRNNDGKMIPLRSLVEVRVVVGPPALIRYNNVRAVTVQGRPAPGVSSGQALKAMEEVAAKTLPAGFVGEWTDTAFQEKRAEGKTAMILGLAVLFAYLFLVGLYESWTIPMPVLLSVSVGVLGSFIAIIQRQADTRPLCPNRFGGADRARGEERHFDRPVRQGKARTGRSAAGSRDGRRATAFPSGHDDVVRFHPGTVAIGDRDRRGATCATRRRHARVWRHDPRRLYRHLRHSAPLCDVPGDPRTAEAYSATTNPAERLSRNAIRCDGVRQGGE